MNDIIVISYYVCIVVNKDVYCVNVETIEKIGCSRFGIGYSKYSRVNRFKGIVR
ncbi:MAG TPA: hypothetical protein VFX18_05575 [Candidatus Nitrosocosmicus sp.]|nr:hypothetical protein [Candidatus Nitrosocosmicus sp.]